MSIRPTGQRAIIVLIYMLLFSICAEAQDTLPPRRSNFGVGWGRTDADRVRTKYLNIGPFVATDTLKGVQIGLFSAATSRSMSGLNIGGVFIGGSGKARGAQITMGLNAHGGTFTGLQVAGIVNVGATLRGVQVGGFTNIAGLPSDVVQVSLLTNIAQGIRRGAQASIGANICSTRMQGLQLGGYNYADTLTGSQWGVLNVCMTHPRGVQVGIINYSRDTVGTKIGLVNITPRSRIDLLVFGGNTSRLNFAVRIRNRSTYRIIGVGTHYMGFSEDFSGAIFYRLGQYFNLSPRWSVSGDVGIGHIETFKKNSTDGPRRLYSLQIHVGADYQITPLIGAFVSTGYGDTRYYGHHREYRNRAVVQAGLSIRFKRQGDSWKKADRL